MLRDFLRCKKKLADYILKLVILSRTVKKDRQLLFEWFFALFCKNIKMAASIAEDRSLNVIKQGYPKKAHIFQIGDNVT